MKRLLESVQPGVPGAHLPRETLTTEIAVAERDRPGPAPLGLLDHLAVPLIVLGQIYQCHGEPERARAHYEEALPLAEEAGDPQLLFPCYDDLATFALQTGNDDQAEHWMERAQAVCERAGVHPDALVVLPFLG